MGRVINLSASNKLNLGASPKLEQPLVQVNLENDYTIQIYKDYIQILRYNQFLFRYHITNDLIGLCVSKSNAIEFSVKELYAAANFERYLPTLE